MNQSVNQSINQSINQANKQLINQSINQSISQSISQSVNQSVSQSINQSTSQSIKKSISHSIIQISQSINHSISIIHFTLVGKTSYGCPPLYSIQGIFGFEATEPHAVINTFSPGFVRSAPLYTTIHLKQSDPVDSPSTFIYMPKPSQTPTTRAASKSIKASFLQRAPRQIL